MNKQFNLEKLDSQISGFMKQEGIIIDDLSHMDMKKFGVMLGRFSERYGYTDEQMETASLSWASSKAFIIK